MDQERQAFADSHVDENDEISLLDLLLALVRNRWLILKVVAVCLGFGLLVAIFSPTEYTAQARVIRETGEQKATGGLAGLATLRGLGISLGSTTAGITVDTYPDILRSREVRLLVANSPFYFEDVDTPMSLVDYQNRPPGILGSVLRGLKAVTIGLPGTIRNILQSHTPELASNISNSDILSVTKEEEKTIRWLANLMTIKVDRASGIMTVLVTTHSPSLSAQLASTIIKHLKQRVQEIYTEKTRESVEFIRARFQESQNELLVAEEELARFTDRNLNPQTAKLNVELERLRRIVTFKTQLYSDLQTQLTQAEIELQRSQPVITFVEAPVEPLQPSGPRRRMIVILALFLGAGLGVAVVAVKSVIENQKSDEESRAKLTEIKESLLPGSFTSWRNRS
ncbi:MAG: hypothetical protein JSW54_13540 [Fidelibacterota bacterium]|nr:MAG: hypothetical protein JSW54_13540 [Candidatus Neomarinimicrobiota bacterium]